MFWACMVKITEILVKLANRHRHFKIMDTYTIPTLMILIFSLL